ncbi:MOSC domain-containing protein [Pseudomonas asuensis]|uniref:MOSC domain-containing protein n=1 Tax=Pseudomonas asuensis TaxID=1825787 RepID=A0ABQ2H3X2_9PSED|nr:MOSC domain-containing protein [Pseudomonas asuensis]GGM27014.1 MOSC domain-containing protein [Pseudomonas asuensis]
MLHLSGLYRYPVKSTAPEPLERAFIDRLGVAGDRRWMVVDASTGRFLTQRLLPTMGQIVARWASDTCLLLNAPGMPELQVSVPPANEALQGVTLWRDTFQVPDAGEKANTWLSTFLARPCRLVYMPESRARQVDTAYAKPGDHVNFADGFPLLLIGQASLDDLARRVGMPLDMRRFRPNLVVNGSEAYAEDHWRHIRIGEVEFQVVKPCSRCVLITVDPVTSVRSQDREPLATLKTYREHEGAVYFGQNLIQLSPGTVSVGMPIELLA